MGNITVSVVLAAKNEETHVREAVESVLAQTEISHELVFVDDGSTDRTYEIVSEIAKAHSNLRLVRNPGAGKVSAFNFGVQQSSGDWVCIFAGDDIMPPGSLAARWRTVKDIESDKPVVGLSRLKQMSEDKKQDGVVVPKNPNRGGFTGTSYLMDRRAVAKVFPVPTSLPNEDTWLETAVLHMDLKLVHSGIIGNHWRVHSGNSINMLLPWEMFNERLTPRMGAYRLFLHKHGPELSAESRRRLLAKASCEDARREGSIIAIFLSDVSTVEKLRAVALSGPFFYEVRRRLYRLLSGW